MLTEFHLSKINDYFINIHLRISLIKICQLEQQQQKDIFIMLEGNVLQDFLYGQF